MQNIKVGKFVKWTHKVIENKQFGNSYASQRFNRFKKLQLA